MAKNLFLKRLLPVITAMTVGLIAIQAQDADYVNGQYCTISVDEGVNRYPVPTGIYIIAGKTILIKQ